MISFLTSARHPNIVQYSGSYRNPDTQLPVLLMELMDEGGGRGVAVGEESVHYIDHSRSDVMFCS